MKLRRSFLISMALIASILFSNTAVFAKTAQREIDDNLACTHEECGSQVYYKIEDKVLTIYGEGAMCDFAIYRFMDYFESPWYWDDFDHIVIEPGITHIGSYAFAFCAPMSITIPDTVTSVGYEAFYGCILTEVIYNGTIAQWEQIDDNSCDGNLTQNPVICTDGIYNATVNGGTWTLSEGTLTILENTSGAWFDPCLEDWPFSEVPWFTYRKHIDEIVIADGVTSICGGAFMWLYVDRIIIPASVTYFGYYSFHSYSANKIYFTGTEAQWSMIGMDDCGFTYDVTPIFSCPHSEAAGVCVVCGKTLISGHEHTYTFYLSNNDATCTQDGTKTAKCNYCNMTDTKVDVGSALGHSFTEYLSNGDGTMTAFCDRCDASDIIPEEGPKSGTCGENLQWVLGADGILKISGTGAMTDFTYDFDTATTDIPWHSFRSNITGIEIAPGVTTIGKYAFRDLAGVTSVTIPTGVTSIGSSAFWLCTGLKTVEIPETVTAIGGYAFYKCSALTSATVPDGITAINNSVFYQCSAMTQVTLPATVISIGDSAFRGCSALKDVYFGGTQAQWNTIALGGNNNPLVSATLRCSDVEENKPEGWVEEEGYRYYYENGTMLKNRWLLDGGKWYWLGADGKMAVNCWREDSKGWVYLGKDGAMLVNAWCTDSQGWCYVGADGYAVTNCWKKDSYGWIWLGSQGSMTKNTWIKDGGKWYFLDANGYMVSNQWRKDSKGWCWLTASGAMATNQWVKDSKGWCYVGADGYCWTNCWAKDSIGWIWLDKEGSMTKSKWIYTGGCWYYLDVQGYMLANTSRNIGGKTYNFNASGVCTNP